MPLIEFMLVKWESHHENHSEVILIVTRFMRSFEVPDEKEEHGTMA